MSLALATLLYEWRRYTAAIVALAFSGLLVLAMAGMFMGMGKSFTATIDRSAADVMVLAPGATRLFNGPSGVPRRIMPQIYTHPDVVTVERVIASPPEPIFALLVDPQRHREIDGSGTVREAKGEAPKLELGSRFGMSMRLGVSYSMVSTVVEYEENRRIAWQTRGPGPLGSRVGGRIWRYELEPVDGGTLVRESWDITQESAITRPLVRLTAAGSTRKNMAATLARIEDLVTA